MIHQRSRSCVVAELGLDPSSLLGMGLAKTCSSSGKAAEARPGGRVGGWALPCRWVSAGLRASAPAMRCPRGSEPCTRPWLHSLWLGSVPVCLSMFSSYTALRDVMP